MVRVLAAACLAWSHPWNQQDLFDYYPGKIAVRPEHPIYVVSLPRDRFLAPGHAAQDLPGC
jgi:hypothetical protein